MKTPSPQMHSWPIAAFLLAGLTGCSPTESTPAMPKAPPKVVTVSPSSTPPAPKEAKTEPAPRPALPEKVVLDGSVLKHLSGAWKLTPEGLEVIKQIAEKVHAFGSELSLEVNGYTSSTGTRAQNLAVSRHRADCVAKALVGAGIPESWITMKGLGPENPVADNATPEGRLRNQRVEVEFKAH